MATIPADVDKRLQSGIDCLNAACGAIDDEMFSAQLRLALKLFTDAVDIVRENLNPRSVREIEFAFDGIVALAGDLAPSDRESLETCFRQLSSEMARLKEAASLPPALVAQITQFREKLLARKKAVERQVYQPPAAGAPDPAPHPPQQLQSEAQMLQQKLREAGFDTPGIDLMASEPESVFMRQIVDVIEELEAIVG